MKVFRTILFFHLFLVLCSCSKNNLESVQVKGSIQKGPFTIGTAVTLNELDSSLTQTGRVFNTVVETDNGRYDFGDISLESKYVMLTASGYFFNEVFGTLSSDPIWLQAIVDLTDVSAVNVNVLTHLTKARIESLLKQKLSFKEAKDQTEKEFLSFLNADEDVQSTFESLDLSSKAEEDAVLLAFSIILNLKNPAHSTENTAALSELLNRIRQDFTPDGVVDNKGVIDTLLYNISQLNLPEVREQIESRFNSIGLPTPVGDFEKYVMKFQEKYAKILYGNFFYPDSAGLLGWPPDAKMPNILNESIPVKQAVYVVAAIAPLNSTLKIALKYTGSGWLLYGMEDGFNVVTVANGATYTGLRQNELMTGWLQLMGHGSLTIEYYENSPDIPTKTRKVDW